MIGIKIKRALLNRYRRAILLVLQGITFLVKEKNGLSSLRYRRIQKNGIVNDNTIESIYCHWGGLPESNGRILCGHFCNREKLKELMALGNLSELHPRLHPIGKHSFYQPEQGTTVAHHRDRGDAWEKTCPQKFSSLKEFLEQPLGNLDTEYLYVLTKKGQWTVYSTRVNKPVRRKRDLAILLKGKMSKKIT